MSSESANIEPATTKKRFLIASVQGHKIAVLKKEVERVIRKGKLTYLPGSPNGLLGLMNLYGEALPVISLYKRINGEIGNKSNNGVLLLVNQAKLVGILVDQVDGVKLGDHELDATLKSGMKIPSQFTNGIAHIEDQEALQVINIKELIHYEITVQAPKKERRSLVNWGSFSELDKPPDLHLLIAKRGDIWMAIQPNEIEQISRLPFSKSKSDNKSDVHWARHGLVNIPMLDPCIYSDHYENTEEIEKTPLCIILKADENRIALVTDHIKGFEILNINSFKKQAEGIPNFVDSVSKWKEKKLWLLKYAQLKIVLDGTIKMTG